MNDLATYFNNTPGSGVLSTADRDGVVDAALYARPHVLEGGTVAFIMPDHVTHRNLQENPHAVYLFIEEHASDGREWHGTRLYMTKIHEEKDTERLYAMRRRTSEGDREGRFLVVFSVDRVRPLVGGDLDA